MHFTEPVDTHAAFFRSRSVLLISVLALLISLNFPHPVKAEATQVVVDVPIYSASVSERSLTLEAELLVSQTIDQQFSQNPGLTTLKVLAMANRNGEVVPILETNVSRADWQEQPQVSIWTRYYDASFELVQRHNVQPSTLIASSVSSTSSDRQTASSARSTILIDRLVDEGRLRGTDAQEVLSSID